MRKTGAENLWPRRAIVATIAEGLPDITHKMRQRLIRHDDIPLGGLDQLRIRRKGSKKV